MSKYIIELDENVKKVVAISLEDAIMWTDEMEVDDLEELNSDYINEHFGDLQDEAYKRGLEEGKKATWGLVADASSAEYQRGLDDAWEAARKIAQQWENDTDTEHRVVIDDSIRVTLDSMTASEAIAKLKAYEEQKKADDKIKVGDEVDWSGDKFIVTRIFKPYDKAEECDGVDMDGCTYHDVLISGLTKTGRHVDITDMLKGALE